LTPATRGDQGKHGDQEKAEGEHGHEIPCLRGDFRDSEKAGLVRRSRFQVAGVTRPRRQ
jgi:hypothetical protein